jgi:hypothetical protein
MGTANFHLWRLNYPWGIIRIGVERLLFNNIGTGCRYEIFLQLSLFTHTHRKVHPHKTRTHTHTHIKGEENNLVDLVVGLLESSLLLRGRVRGLLLGSILCLGVRLLKIA